ncbi:ISL3 family transposase [Nonomuraea sp. B19D2]|uniref:ISL3 family transposase n=1 Tax=Nonomuraea sp. B19D2 TaxID=3159561 RepID=UPI0032DB4099
MQHPSAGEEACCCRLFLPHLQDVLIENIEDRADHVLVTARACMINALCPGCGVLTGKVHGHYQRRLHDLATYGRPVLINLRVRRFRCANLGCERRTFVEQVPRVSARHARRTPALRRMLEQIALALAGRAGSRLAQALGLHVSRSTLIRLLRALPQIEAGPVTVLGVDDFAKKRGNSYGTVLVDMHTHRPIDLLDDRKADTLAAWLKAHPEVEVICRDRAGGYADGARTGAPTAVQVADRWHLWQNLAEALDKTVRAHRACLREESRPETTTAPQPQIPDQKGEESPMIVRMTERYAQVQALHASGASLNSISRELGLAFRTVRRFATATSLEELLAPTLDRVAMLDPFKPYLTRRWNDGCTDSTQLHHEIKAQGWTGSLRTVQRYLRPFRGQLQVSIAPSPPTKPRHVVGWIMSHPDHLDQQDTARLAEILTRCPELQAAAGHVRDFAVMMTQRQGHRLDDWITATAADGGPHLASFATGLRSDHAAVTAGLTLSHSSGAVEGIVNKIKFLKRQMFGRASFDLLRIRVLNYH